MKKSAILILVSWFALSVFAEQKIIRCNPNHVSGRFVLCENNAGGGFFWVLTSTGKVWWANPKTNEWVYFGCPDGEHENEGMYGRYIPYANKNGSGLYIMNVITGEGWWTNGSEWKKMGIPKD